jgi:hypothetical protein
MKKRVLAGLLMSVMVLASAMSVSATGNGSKTKPVVGGDTADGKGSYVVTTENPKFEGLTDAAIDANTNIPAEKKEEAKKTAKAVATVIEKVNKGEAVSITTEVDKEIKGKTAVTKFFDVEDVGDHTNCNHAGHKVTLTVDAMTTAWKNIVVVHYSTDQVAWETISVADKDVDYTNKKITFTVKDFSPMAIYADVVESGTAGTSPSTEGVSSAWMLYAAMALIVLGSGVVVYQKKRG